MSKKYTATLVWNEALTEAPDDTIKELTKQMRGVASGMPNTNPARRLSITFNQVEGGRGVNIGKEEIQIDTSLDKPTQPWRRLVVHELAHALTEEYGHHEDWANLYLEGIRKLYPQFEKDTQRELQRYSGLGEGKGPRFNDIASSPCVCVAHRGNGYMETYHEILEDLKG
jgi:hypothetical protein